MSVIYSLKQGNTVLETKTCTEKDRGVLFDEFLDPGEYTVEITTPAYATTVTKDNINKYQATPNNNYSVTSTPASQAVTVTVEAANIARADFSHTIRKAANTYYTVYLHSSVAHTANEGISNNDGSGYYAYKRFLEFPAGETVTMTFDNRNKDYNPYAGRTVYINNQVLGVVGQDGTHDSEGRMSLTFTVDGDKDIYVSDTDYGSMSNVLFSNVLSFSPTGRELDSLPAGTTIPLRSRRLNLMRGSGDGDRDDVIDVVNDGNAPSSSDPNMSYTLDPNWECMITLDKDDLSNGKWKETVLGANVKDLVDHDINGNQYLYYIAEIHESGQLPETVAVIGKAGNKILTVSSTDNNHPLTLTNTVPYPTSITIQKTDDNSVALPGAKFELYKTSGTSAGFIQEVDMSSNASVTVSGLYAGDYKLIETQEPKGYLKLQDEILFTISNNVITGTSGSNKVSLSGNTLTISNTPYKTNIKINKIDQETRNNSIPTSLSGAYFRLYKRSSGGTYDASTVSNYGREGGIEATNGILTYENLIDGEYKIEEVHTPKGYVKTDNNNIYFTLAKGVVTRHTAPDPENSSTIWTEIPVSSSVADITYIKASGDTVATFTVGNNKGAALPSTGGAGTTLFYLIGVLMCILGGTGILMKRKAA
ncbi:MAG: LPXTG cell wall anchor domain-containing protein [Blautia sp.]|nr:LPXTG cell wall anchor domain-containing protein [Blautia sp.]